jgi:hypothetical protein
VAGGSLQGYERQYLDSAELHYWLQSYKAFLTKGDTDQEMPIFVFDLPSSQTVLLDGFHQVSQHKTVVCLNLSGCLIS